jgi:hypothetical protein
LTSLSRHDQHNLTRLDSGSDQPDGFVLVSAAFQHRRQEFVHWLIERQTEGKAPPAIGLDELGEGTTPLTQALVNLLYQKFCHAIPSVDRS